MMRDELGTLFTDDDFAALFATRGQPAEAPCRLAPVTIRPDVEDVSDRQAAEAVRVGSIGSMPSVESPPTLVSTARSSERFVPVWSWGPPNSACSMPSWTAAANTSGSKPADASAPTPRMCWRACVLSSA